MERKYWFLETVDAFLDLRMRAGKNEKILLKYQMEIAEKGRLALY